MVTVRDIITDAYRVGGVIGLSEQPDADEADFALMGLQSMFQSWINKGMFGTMKDVYTTEDYTANEGERITVDSATVTIPYTFQDGCDGFQSYGAASSYNHDTRAPKQLSAITVVTDTATTSYIYDRRQWSPIETLTLDDECPLSDYGRRGLACCLALELSELPAFGGTITNGMVTASQSFKHSVIASRYAAHNIIEPRYF